MRLPAKQLAAIIAVSFGLMEAAYGQARGRAANAKPPEPTPRNAEGRAILGGVPGSKQGVWTPRFGVTDPIAKLETVPFQPWSKALYTDRQRHELEPHARCKASGAARQFLTPYGVEFVELPEIQKMYIFDIGGPHTFRTIYMDGRKHPAKLTPSFYGHSIGWWEGDTLVVDSVGFNEDFWIDRGQIPHTTQLHLIEKYTRTALDTMKYELTVDDPGAYTSTFTGTSTLRWESGTELFEYICQQENYAFTLMVGEGTKVDRTSPIVP